MFKDITIISLNPDINIFVGDNDSGKTTILEAIAIATTGKLNGLLFSRQLNLDSFNIKTRNEFKTNKTSDIKELPQIIIEIVCKPDESIIKFKGTNNLRRQDLHGLRVIAEFDNAYAEVYQKYLKADKIKDIPIEFYKVDFIGFDGTPIRAITSPFHTICIDTAKKDYGQVLNRFVVDHLSVVDEEDRKKLSVSYRANKHQFNTSEELGRLNKKISEERTFADKNISLQLRETKIDDWESEISLVVEDIPFSNVGFGTQNTIKIEMALLDKENALNTIILEEPENNLSFSNMNRLISKVSGNTNKQIFISTHSSFVSNRLGLKYIKLVGKNSISSFKDLPEDTVDFFKKSSNYDTLRLLLAKETILVEGPADDLILQKAYMKKYKNQPIEDGVDVIQVNGLSFKRYLDIANLITKKIKVVTDNDGKDETEVKRRYADYINEHMFFFSDKKEQSTLEICVYEENKDSPDFKNMIYKGNKKLDTDKDWLEFMKNNKTEWSMRVFKSDKTIQYPQYIENAIKK